MRRLFALGLVLFFSIAACQAGHPAASPGAGRAVPNLSAQQRLRIALPEAPRSFDPALQYLASEEAIGRLYAEPLLRPNSDLTDVEGGAAQSYEVSADGLTYTFHLRPNGHYNDGRPVVAADFVYAWKRLIDPRIAAPHADFFAAAVAGGVVAQSLDPKNDGPRIDPALNALGLKAVNDLEFQVRLPEPEGYFKWVATLWNGAPIRPDVIQAHGAGWSSRPDTLVTNGPYQVTAMGANVTLTANPHYWGGRPPVVQVVASVITDPASALKRYQAGELDLAPVPAELAEQVATDHLLAGEVVKAPRLTQHWVDFNTSKAPFDNLKVRQAFAAAIDRPAYIKDVLKGQGSPATALIPLGMPGHPNQPATGQAFDAAGARSLLAASGEPSSQFDGVHLLVADQPVDRAGAENLSAQLQANLGISITVEALTAPKLAGRLQHGDFQIAGPVGWTADYPDPQDWLALFRSTDDRDYPHWRNQRYDLLVELGDQTQDEAKRLQAYAQAQQMLVADTPFVLLEQRQDWILKKPYVAGIQATALDDGAFPGGLFATRIYIANH